MYQWDHLVYQVISHLLDFLRVQKKHGVYSPRAIVHQGLVWLNFLFFFLECIHGKNYATHLIHPSPYLPVLSKKKYIHFYVTLNRETPRPKRIKQGESEYVLFKIDRERISSPTENRTGRTCMCGVFFFFSLRKTLKKKKEKEKVPYQQVKPMSFLFVQGLFLISNNDFQKIVEEKTFEEKVHM
ncbi:hypothetical protein BDF14DRAFT_111534 [Spinellus fusiger]|nr:hypothetical protein BDF14DRAFT_111534 [Spinellus fusiger]